MAKKPEDEFEITDDDIAGLGTKDPAVVDVSDDAAPEGAQAPKAPAFEASETLKAELDTLRKQNEEFAAESQRRERELAEERAKNIKAETELTDSRIQTIENALALNDGKLREAKAAYAAAMSEGAFDKAADAQDQIASLAVDRKRLQEGRTAIEMQIEQAKESPVQQQRQPTIDDFFNTLPPAQKQWATEHREWFSSPAKNARVIAAHWDAVENQGLREGSPQYFEAIETSLGIRQAPDTGRSDAEPRRQQSAPAAPVSRGAPSMTSGRPSNGKIKLPPEMVEAAMIAGLSPSEYYAAMTPEERARIRH